MSAISEESPAQKQREIEESVNRCVRAAYKDANRIYGNAKVHDDDGCRVGDAEAMEYILTRIARYLPPRYHQNILALDKAFAHNMCRGELIKFLGNAWWNV